MSVVMEAGDERLSNVFEMLVSRIDHVEDYLVSVREALARQDMSARHADSMRPLGSPFSGVALTGHCVELTTHNKFDANGDFELFHPASWVLAITCDQLVNEIGPVELMWIDKKTPWKWDDDMQAAWGPEKYDSTREKMEAWYEANPQQPGQDLEDPTCLDLGINSHHDLMIEEIFDAALLYRNPGLIAVREEGILISLCSIKDCFSVVSKVLRDFEYPSPKRMSVFCVEKHLVPLALACLSPKSDTVQDIYSALNDSQRSPLMNPEHNHAFFTYERMDKAGLD